jgi:outer membrane protein assembly factor BamB
MLRVVLLLCLVFAGTSTHLAAEHWPQGTGPAANFGVRATDVPLQWSVVRNQKIRWRKPLSETGQSTVVVWGGRIFFSTLQDVDQDSELGQNIVAYCCDAATGKTLWTRHVRADHPLRLSGCFSDSSAPPPVTDGKRVCFFNASGRITCFDFDGAEQWTRTLMAVGRSQPFLLGGNVVFTRQTYMPDEKGHFSHAHKNAPVAEWTQLQSLNLKTGEAAWTSQCGVNMGCIPLPHRLASGRQVVIVGRGGGHSPPETPEGVSMIDGETGETIWTLPLTGFMSTMTFAMHDGQVLVFHGPEHLWVDGQTGSVVRRVSIMVDIPLRGHSDGRYQTTSVTLPSGKKRCIIQSSNLLAGDFHYFRSYTHPYLGRVNVRSGKVEYLQLPVQLMREPNADTDQLLWDAGDIPAAFDNKPAKKKPPITQWAFRANDMKNSRGFVVMGDKRSRGNGWGHHAAAVPTVLGDHLFVPTMSGTVYVVDHDADVLDEKAVVAINDLGPIGQSWNRASLSFAAGRIFAHMIREVICIGD